MDFLGIPTSINLQPGTVLSDGLKMYMVEGKTGAIGCMLVGLLFLGTWPAILTMLERRGRLPQHIYLDYSITNLLAALAIAFTFGQLGGNQPNFLDQLSQDNWPSVLCAMAGGVFLSLGNLSNQYAWAYVGLSVAQVITASIAVVIGTTVNYFLDDKINKAQILFPGVACFLIAVCLASVLHESNTADNEAKISGLSEEGLGDDFGTGNRSSVSLSNSETKASQSHGYGSYAISHLLLGLCRHCKQLRLKGVSFAEEIDSKSAISGNSDVESVYSMEEPEVGSAHFLLDVENKRAIKVLGKSTFVGLAIAFFAGVCYALFSPAFNIATNDQWHMLKAGVQHITVYTAFFYFSLACFVIAIILNISFLYRPVLSLPKSSIRNYLSDWDGRGMAMMAGLLCGFGNGLQFMGGQAAGYAAADAVQALPLVSTFWGIVLFGEYRKSSQRTYILLVSMLLMFVVAVGLLLASAGVRK